MDFSKEEMVDMIFIFGEAQKNALLATRLYVQRYPERRHPRQEAFVRVAERFINSGSVCYPKQTRTMADEESEFQVVASLLENPKVSTRELSANLDLNRSTIRRFIKKNKFHPYHIEQHQALTEIDFQNRETFCQWITNKINDEPNFVNNILFTDEATFHNNANFNKHNYHYYSDSNPHILRVADHQHRWSVNVWGGIFDCNVIGPFFFDESLTGERYLRFLETNLFDLLEDIDLHRIQTMWFQQDGAPPHYAINVRRYLNETFPMKWIGRGGVVNWPARSPDLTSLDFFLWGYVREIVYKDPPTTREDMKNRIRAAFESITPEMLSHVKRSFSDRIQNCLARHGQHFEHLF